MNYVSVIWNVKPGRGLRCLTVGVRIDANDLSFVMSSSQEPEVQLAVIQVKLRRTGGEGGVIALDRAGNVAMDFNSVGMFRGARDSSGRRELAIYRDAQ